MNLPTPYWQSDDGTVTPTDAGPDRREARLRTPAMTLGQAQACLGVTRGEALRLARACGFEIPAMETTEFITREMFAAMVKKKRERTCG